MPEYLRFDPKYDRLGKAIDWIRKALPEGVENLESLFDFFRQQESEKIFYWITRLNAYIIGARNRTADLYDGNIQFDNGTVLIWQAPPFDERHDYMIKAIDRLKDGANETPVDTEVIPYTHVIARTLNNIIVWAHPFRNGNGRTSQACYALFNGLLGGREDLSIFQDEHVDDEIAKFTYNDNTFKYIYHQLLLDLARERGIPQIAGLEIVFDESDEASEREIHMGVSKEFGYLGILTLLGSSTDERVRELLKTDEGTVVVDVNKISKEEFKKFIFPSMYKNSDPPFYIEAKRRFFRKLIEVSTDRSNDFDRDFGSPLSPKET